MNWEERVGFLRGSPWVATAGAMLLRGIGSTWRVRFQVPDAVDPRRKAPGRRYVYLIWHRTILMASHVFRDLGICVGVSLHGDGEIGARIAERLGFRTARGSSTRGATRLLRGMLAFGSSNDGDVALTADGPRGPPGRAKPGALYLSARLGWPIVPLAFSARPRRELASWDRFIVPWPFARIGVVACDPISIAPDATGDDLHRHARDIESRLGEAEAAAEALAS